MLLPPSDQLLAAIESENWSALQALVLSRYQPPPPTSTVRVALPCAAHSPQPQPQHSHSTAQDK